MYITAQGTLRVLVVFATFPDDNNYHPYWPIGQPPNELNTFIDPNMQTGSTHYANLTHFFKDMSMGTYQVIGEAVYAVTPCSSSYYGSDFGKANKEILRDVVDPIINFTLYDNWEYQYPYHHATRADNVIDMIIMIWRGLPWGSAWLGNAKLGGSSFKVENLTKTIKCNYPDVGGSGITIQYWGERDQARNFRTTVHELGHWLLGLVHPYGSSGRAYAKWSLLGHGFTDGICANTFERERLAWIYPTSINEEIINAPIGDYLTTGTAYKFHPSNGYTYEYYYFENHQKLNSTYDDATINEEDKGILILHQQGLYNGTNCLRIKTADGFYNWQNPYNTNECFSQTLPAFMKTTVNRLGYGHRDQLLKSGGGYEWLYAFIDKYGVINCGSFKQGENFLGAYNLVYNKVFSRWSNPKSFTWSNQPTDFAFDIFNQVGSQINVHFYYNNGLAASPSKPQNLVASLTPAPGYQIFYPRLSWSANKEDDLNGYKIQRKITYNSQIIENWHYIAYPTKFDSVFIDYGLPCLPSGEYDLYYKIQAKDNDQKLSSFSEEAVINNVQWEPKKEELIQNATVIPLETELYSNFPNPFNPETNISFGLPKDDWVELNIYSVTGQRIVQLVNEQLEKGYHTVAWNGRDGNGNSVASGLYIYELLADGKRLVNKMFLMK